MRLRLSDASNKNKFSDIKTTFAIFLLLFLLRGYPISMIFKDQNPHTLDELYLGGPLICKAM